MVCSLLFTAPPFWPTIYRVIRPALSYHTRNAAKMFSTNKKQWMPYIHARIDPKQLPPYFGGTKTDENDIVD